MNQRGFEEQLPKPPGVWQAKVAHEVLRVWMVNGEIATSANYADGGNTPEADMFANALASISIDYCSTLEKMGRMPFKDGLSMLKRALEKAVAEDEASPRTDSLTDLSGTSEA